MKKRKKDWWIGSAQVYVDDLGYARGVVIYEHAGKGRGR